MTNVNYIVVLSATHTSCWSSGEPDGSSFVETSVSEVQDVLEFESAWQAADAIRDIREDSQYTNVAIGFARVGNVCLGL